MEMFKKRYFCCLQMRFASANKNDQIVNLVLQEICCRLTSLTCAIVAFDSTKHLILAELLSIVKPWMLICGSSVSAFIFGFGPLEFLSNSTLWGIKNTPKNVFTITFTKHDRFR